MLIEIKNRFSGAVLFSHDCEGNTMMLTVSAAIQVGAYLSGADLSGANLSGADLSGANAVIDAGVPDSYCCVAWFNGTIQLRVGCRNKTMAEGREYWAGKEDRCEIMAALDYIEAVAKIRGWK